MAATMEQKKERVAELIKNLENAKSVAFTKYDGISVANLTGLRRSLREEGSEIKVYKKTLVKIAVKEMGIENLPDESLDGQIAVAFSFDEPMSAPQVIKKMSKKMKNLQLTGGIFEGKVLNAAEINELASLPSKEVLLSKLLGTMSAPIQGFVSVGQGVIAGFVRTLDAVSQQKEA